MAQPHSLLELLRTKTGSDDLLRTLLRAQAAHTQTAVRSVVGGAAVRVVPLNKTEQATRRGPRG